MFTDSDAGAAGKPDIRLVDAEADLISDIAMLMEQRAPRLAAMLLDEIDRAEICSAGAIPADTVRIGSRVEFVNEATGGVHDVTLVLPHEADAAVGAISVFTPAGAGLIGLSTGQSIRWADDDGVERRLRVISVQPPSLDR
jgi:regulator of nucleoside diphosphate kinase